MIQLAEQGQEVRSQRSEISNQIPEITPDGVGPNYASITSSLANVALLTGGDDRPYVLGLAPALTSKGITLDVIGSDDLELPELLNNSSVNFLNLRGDQRSDANLQSKMARVLRYYWRLLCYAATAKTKVFHILWNNKFELFDRTLLMLYYKLMRKRIVLTVHNVN